MLNVVCLCGRLVADPDIRVTTGGKHVANFTLAVPKRYANPESTDTADFFQCVAWNQQADYCENYLTKGRLISLSGRLQTRKYTKGDETRVITEIIIENVNGMDKPRDAQPEAVPSAPASDLDTVDPFADE